MGKLLNTDLETLKTSSNFVFSATKLPDLGASEYTLASIVCDVSGSVQPFGPQLETMLKTIFKACQKSPRADNLMLRLTQFGSTINELHGFKQLNAIKEDDYTNILQIGGYTKLIDASIEGIEATTTYGKTLMSQDYLVNGIVIIVTDGENNTGSSDATLIKKAIDAAGKNESLESLTVILVGVTNDDTSLNAYLQNFKDTSGISQYQSIGTATPGKIAKLAQFVSQSISSTSQSLGSGGPSQSIKPTF